MAGLQLSHVSKSFGDIRVLEDINLVVADGAFVVFVGPSGCGKSTLLRIIAGLEEVTEGEVRIGDIRVNDKPPAERGVAMVFQSYALYPHMTVYENMAFGLRLAKADKAEVDKAVRAAAETLHIEALLDRKPRALSGGQRQRVAIGRAIVRKPQVFLLDEPLSNLDAALRVRMRYEFAKLHQDLETTMIYVTHDQVEAMTLADQIVVLSAGRIEQIGAPMQLYNHPDNLFVAGFIGSPKMNFIRGEIVDAVAGSATVRLGSGEMISVAAEAPSSAKGDEVTLGVRPEHFDPRVASNPISAKVNFVELLGSTTFAYVTLSGTDTDLTVQLPGDVSVTAGETIRIGVAAAACHLFDARGMALARPGQEPNPAFESVRKAV